MMARRIGIALWLVVCVLNHAVQCGEIHPLGDWPQFQGLHGDGSSAETGLLKKWSDGGPTLLWRQKFKQGWGSPSIVRDDFYLGWTEQRRGDEKTVA
ncbi:MAG: hypothetical protein NT013_01865 [Planctomycetia bacterium]|nr:hypothetical protein [Planctomycetia bacterium]